MPGKPDPEFKTRQPMSRWERGMNAENARDVGVSPMDAQAVRVEIRVDEKKREQTKRQRLPGGRRKTRRSLQRKTRKNRR